MMSEYWAAASNDQQLTFWRLRIERADNVDADLQSHRFAQSVVIGQVGNAIKHLSCILEA